MLSKGRREAVIKIVAQISLVSSWLGRFLRFRFLRPLRIMVLRAHHNGEELYVSYRLERKAIKARRRAKYKQDFARGAFRQEIFNKTTAVRIEPLPLSLKRSLGIVKNRNELENSVIARPPVEGPQGEVSQYSAVTDGGQGARPGPKILVLVLAHMGDFILSLRSLEMIRNGFPQAHITLVCAPWCLEWANRIDLFDDIKLFQFFTALNRDWRGPTEETYERFLNLGLGRFDIAIDLRHDADTRPCLYRVDASFRAGFVAPFEAGLPHLDLMLPPVELMKVPNSDIRYSLHAERRLQLLASAVVNECQAYENAIARLVRNDSGAGRNLAIVSLSAGDPIRYWPIADYREVALHLAQELGMEIVVLGGNAERDLCQDLVARLPAGMAQAKCDVRIEDLPDLLASAAIVVGNGTGVTHLSAVLAIPTVTILTGVTPIDVWRPNGERTITLTTLMRCSPCGLRLESDCSFGVECQRAVRPSDVISAIQDLLAGNQGSANSLLSLLDPPLAGLSSQ